MAWKPKDKVNNISGIQDLTNNSKHDDKNISEIQYPVLSSKYSMIPSSQNNIKKHNQDAITSGKENILPCMNLKS